jgi:hypothetical protein
VDELCLLVLKIFVVAVVVGVYLVVHLIVLLLLVLAEVS